jgi:hypothetical protein
MISNRVHFFIHYTQTAEIVRSTDFAARKGHQALRIKLTLVLLELYNYAKRIVYVREQYWYERIVQLGHGDET